MYRTHYNKSWLLLLGNTTDSAQKSFLWTGGALYAPYRLLLISNKLCD